MLLLSIFQLCHTGSVQPAVRKQSPVQGALHMIVAALDGSNLDTVKTALPSACHAAQALVFQQHAVCLYVEQNTSEEPQKLITVTVVCYLQMQIEL